MGIEHKPELRIYTSENKEIHKQTPDDKNAQSQKTKKTLKATREKERHIPGNAHKTGDLAETGRPEGRGATYSKKKLTKNTKAVKAFKPVKYFPRHLASCRPHSPALPPKKS